MTELGDTPRVRVARLDDAEALWELYSELADDRSEAQPAGNESTREVLATVLDQTNRRLLVAETSDGQVVGTLDILIVPNLTHQARPWAVGRERRRGRRIPPPRDGVRL